MAYFETLTPFIIVCLGFFLSRLNSKIEDRSVAIVCLMVCIPAMLLRHSMGQGLTSHKFTFILFFILFHYALMYFIASQVFRFVDVPLRTRRLFLLSTLSVSILSLMKMQPGLGEPSEALQTVTILVFFHLAFLSFVGIFLAAGNDRISDNIPQIFKTPLPYILVIGLLFAITGVSLPYDVLDFIDTFHNIVFPIALLTLGLMVGKYLYFFQFAEYSVLLPPLFLCTFFKLLLSPALAMLLITLMGIDDVELQRALIITSGAPTGVFAAIIVSVYGRPNERRFVVLCILVTVLLSFLTLPVLYFFVDKYFPVAVLPQ